MAVLPGVDPNQSLMGLKASFDDIGVSPPSLTMVSGVTGRVIDSNSPMDGEYWRRQARESAALDVCASTLAELGVDIVLEVRPESIQGRTIGDYWPESAGTPTILSTLGMQSTNGQSPESGDAFVRAAATAYEAGLDISFAGLFAGESRRRVSLPTYPFQRRRHWI